MARKPLIPGGRYVEHRAGLGGFVWEGMATKIDPGGSPPTRPRFLENVRIQGGSILSRPDFAGPGALIPAITHYDPSTQEVPVVGGVGETSLKNRMRMNIPGSGGYDLWDPAWASEFNSVGGTRLWWGSTPPLVLSEGLWQVVKTGAMFGFLDTDADPVFNLVGTYDSDDSWPPCIEKFNTEVYVGDFGCLRKVMLIDPPPGQSPAQVLSTPSDFIVLDYPGFRTTAMVEFNGKLWLLLIDPSDATNAEVWSYDGLVAEQDKVLTVSGATGGAFGVFKNELVLTINGEGSIHVRKPDATWTDFTVAGFDSSPYLNSMAQYRDKLMIMDGVDKIYSYDGTALVLEHTIGVIPVNDPRIGTPPDPALAYCCCVLNDIFYYGWTNIDFPAPVLATGGMINHFGSQPDPFAVIRIPTGAGLGYVDYQFVDGSSPLSQYDVKIGATIDDTLTNLHNCINQTHPWPTVGQNHPLGNYVNAITPVGHHPLVQTTLDLGNQRLLITVLLAGETGNITLSAHGSGSLNLFWTNPTGGVGPVGESVMLGKHDGDDPSWDDYYVRNYSIFNWASGTYDWPAADGGITAMAVYRGRIWLAVSGVPSGNSLLMTHSIQYAPYDGWFVCDESTSGNPDEGGNRADLQSFRGPFHGTELSGGQYGELPQIFYLRTI